MEQSELDPPLSAYRSFLSVNLCIHVPMHPARHLSLHLSIPLSVSMYIRISVYARRRWSSRSLTSLYLPIYIYSISVSLSIHRPTRCPYTQVEMEQSELDQRRTLDIERTNALARRLVNAATTRSSPASLMAALDCRGRSTHLCFHPHAPLLLVVDDSSTVSNPQPEF